MKISESWSTNLLFSVWCVCVCVCVCVFCLLTPFLLVLFVLGLCRPFNVMPMTVSCFSRLLQIKKEKSIRNPDFYRFFQKIRKTPHFSRLFSSLPTLIWYEQNPSFICLNSLCIFICPRLYTYQLSGTMLSEIL